MNRIRDLKPTDETLSRVETRVLVADLTLTKRGLYPTMQTMTQPTINNTLQNRMILYNFKITSHVHVVAILTVLAVFYLQNWFLLSFYYADYT